jgi:hypothetical protein
MTHELRYCSLGCCHFVDNQPVSQADYEKAFCNQIEIWIPCRNVPKGHFQKKLEDTVGFYLGTPIHRDFCKVPSGRPPFAFSSATGERLREATTDDIKRWNEVRSTLIAEAHKKA